MSGFEFLPIREPAAQPEEPTSLQQQAFSEGGGGGGAWRAGYNGVAPLAIQATEGNNSQPQDTNGASGSAPWRAGYNQVAPLAIQATEGQNQPQTQTQPQDGSPSNSAAPWRSNYNQVAPLAQQPSDGYNPQAQYPAPTPWRQQYNHTAPIVGPVGFTPPYATGNPQTPIVYEPGTTPGNPLPPGGRYDTGTYGRPPSVTTPRDNRPLFNPGPNGGAAHENPNGGNPNQGRNGTPGDGPKPAPTGNTGDGPSTSDYEAPKDSVAFLPAALLGGAGGYIGGHLAPKYLNPRMDKIANSPNDVTFKSLLESDTAKKLLPDGIRKSLTSRIEKWPAATGEANPLKEVATGWQNNFNPAYRTRTPFQNVLDENSSTLGDLKDKTGLTAENADRLAELQYQKNLHDAAKAAAAPGTKVEPFHGRNTFYKLRKQAEGNGATRDDVTALGDLQGKQDALIDPATGKLNQGLFNAEQGPDLLAKMKAPPFSEAEENLVGKQQKFFDDAAAAASKNPKDAALLERPGLKDFAVGAALVGGGAFVSNALDNMAGGPNALHLDNYGIPAAFLAGDSIGSKLAMTGGVVIGNYALDKVLPAADHATISNLMRPTGWDAAMQGAAFLLPAADNKVRLATLGGAWTMGRLANMDTLPAAGLTGAAMAGTLALARANPELGIGAAALELGAFGVSRVMHAFE